jgi:hypothetical protein
LYPAASHRGPLGILGVAPARQHHPPDPAPAAAAEPELGDLDWRGGLGIHHAPPSVRRVRPDAAGQVGGDPQLDHVVPATPLAPSVQRLDVEPTIGPDEHGPPPTVGQAGHALAEEGAGSRRRPGVARAQLTVDHEPTLALATEQRVVRRAPALVGVGPRPGALLLAVDRLDRRVAVEGVPGLVGQGPPEQAFAHRPQTAQPLRHLEPDQLPVEQRVVRQPVAGALDAEQRLLLEVREVPDALDAQQGAVEEIAQGLGQRVRGPRGLVLAEGVGERPVDPLSGDEVAQRVEAAVPGGAAEGERLVHFPVGDGRGRVRGFHLRRGSFRGLKWTSPNALLPRLGPFPSADSPRHPCCSSTINARPLRNRG